MEIKTKHGPAAILMDTSGTRMGIVKRIVATVNEGHQDNPVIEYVVISNGVTNVIQEKDAIGLFTLEYVQQMVAAALKESAKTSSPDIKSPN